MAFGILSSAVPARRVEQLRHEPTRKDRHTVNTPSTASRVRRNGNNGNGQLAADKHTISPQRHFIANRIASAKSWRKLNRSAHGNQQIKKTPT
jgi:hypothetical protein